MFIYIIVISALVQGFVALFVLLKNPKHLTNILFSALSASLTVWALINFILTNSTLASGHIELFRLLMSAVVVQNVLFFLFSHTYPNIRTGLSRKFLFWYAVLSVVALVVTVSPYLFIKLEYSTGSPRPVTGPGMLLFILHAAISVILGLRSILRKEKTAKGNYKRQLKLILAGSIILWGVVPITNFVLSLATKTLFFAKISPIYTLAFSSTIAYAIVVQKLFDIRSVVARSVAYVGAIALLVFVYTQLTVVITGEILFSSGSSAEQKIISIALAIMVAILFKPVKKFFDKVTNKVFYRDAYDTQALLDELNNILINTPKLSELLEKSTALVQESMKIGHCTVYVKDTAYFPSRVFGSSQEIKQKIEIEDLNQFTETLRKTVYQVNFDDSSRRNSIDKLLHDNDIEILARIVENPNQKGSGEGYMLFGPKNSGTTYSSQDLKLISIISNELVIAIENALRLEEIEQFNVTLQKKIDGATVELKKSNRKLVALDEAKDEFVTMASHQLRTPLTSIKGYVSMVLEGDAGQITSQQKKMLGQTFFSAQRMVYLISDLLNVSRLKTGKFVLEPKPVNLKAIIKSEVDQLNEGFAAKNLHLEIKNPKQFPELNIDEMKIRQVIMNFLDNAIYYTPQDGNITITLDQSSSEASLVVTDTGIGVSKEAQGKLFTKFFRADNARKTRPDGTGLGLFMAKKVIEAHQGKVIFESTEGKGSSFGFSLPLDKVKA